MGIESRRSAARRRGTPVSGMETPAGHAVTGELPALISTDRNVNSSGSRTGRVRAESLTQHVLPRKVMLSTGSAGLSAGDALAFVC